MSAPHEERDGGQTPWLYRRRTISGIFWALVGICLLLVLADFVYPRYGTFAFEEFPAIYGIFGFVSCIFIVFAGIGLRKLVMRDENYYDS